MKEQENASRMLFIQRNLLGGKPNIIAPGRKLLKEGKLMKVSSREYSKIDSPVGLGVRR